MRSVFFRRMLRIVGGLVLFLTLVACQAAWCGEGVDAVSDEPSILEPAATETATVEPPAATPAPEPVPAPTPEQAAAQAEAELKEKREQERQELLKEAEEFVASADEKIINTLPYPLNYLFGVTLFNIPLWRYAAGCGLLLLGILLIWGILFWFRRIRRRVENREPEKRWRRGVDVAILALRNPIKFIIPGLVIRNVSNLLVTAYHPDFVWFSNLLVFLGIVFYFFDLVGIIDTVYGERIFHSNDRLMETVRPILLKIIRAFILFLAFMHIYQAVTGQTMVSVLAGLGIGGLALALASQETLKNLLGFASIAFDKVFLVGDPVNIASYEGVVEHVGIRSLRLRAYNGNSVIIPNSTAINSDIVNLSRRPYIRREIRIALSPANPHEKMVAALDAIRDALDDHEGKIAGLPPVVRFADYEPARFIVQALFWYDAGKPFYLDECSRMNLEICKRLTELGIVYADK